MSFPDDDLHVQQKLDHKLKLASQQMLENQLQQTQQTNPLGIFVGILSTVVSSAAGATAAAGSFIVDSTYSAGEAAISAMSHVSAPIGDVIMGASESITAGISAVSQATSSVFSASTPQGKHIVPQSSLSYNSSPKTGGYACIGEYNLTVFDTNMPGLVIHYDATTDYSGKMKMDTSFPFYLSTTNQKLKEDLEEYFKFSPDDSYIMTTFEKVVKHFQSLPSFDKE